MNILNNASIQYMMCLVRLLFSYAGIMYNHFPDVSIIIIIQ